MSRVSKESNMNTDYLPQRKECVTPGRKGWRGYKPTVCLTSVLRARDGKALLKQQMPDASRADHAELANLHVEAALKNKKLWSSLVDRQMLKMFGRPFKFGDYKVSGVCRDEFDESAKKLLRRYADNGSAHHTLAIFHRMAAGHTHRTSIYFCRARGL
jgi:hypothetical protein